MTALLRTIVPVLWGGLVAFLVGKGWVTPELAETMRGWESAIVAGVGVVATAVVYQVANWLLKQPWFPDAVARLFTGSTKTPRYLD